MSRTPRETLAELIAGVSDGRWDELPALYSHDAVVSHPLALPAPTRLEGREALAAHFAQAARLPLGLAAVDVDIHETADPEVVVGEFDYLVDHPRLSRPVRVANVFAVRVRDGEIVESRDYHDHATLAAAAGALEPVARATQELVDGGVRPASR